jgi:hypothetical protein
MIDSLADAGSRAAFLDLGIERKNTTRIVYVHRFDCRE